MRAFTIGLDPCAIETKKKNGQNAGKKADAKYELQSKVLRIIIHNHGGMTTGLTVMDTVAFIDNINVVIVVMAR